ncbi:MAG: fused MFS/spermidine synthase [Candidatus Marsarchaeota archaeon]|jgi:spermidine synthase|nr:fused MFS/spermidine synthase [Candidatus Marsarchaeota archaeon]
MEKILMDFFDRLFGFGKEVFSVKHNGHTLSIVENSTGKIFKYDGIVYSRIHKNSVYTHEYWDFFIPLGAISENPKFVLIGLGGGTIPYLLHKTFDNMKMDVVEVDREMENIANMFVGKLDNTNVIIQNGQDFVSKNKDAYNVIILDAFISDRIPSVFLSNGFIDDAYECLSDSGIFAINCISSMDGTESIETFIKSLSKKFKVYKLDTGFYTANILLLCAKGLNKEDLIFNIKTRMRINKENEFIIKSYENMKLIL